MRKHLTINGRRLSYLEHSPLGTQGTLVLLHAFPLNAEMWEPQFHDAPSHWRLLAPDFRGFGASDPDAPASLPDGLLEDYAQDVRHLLAELNVRDPVVAGLSLGGYVAFALMRVRLSQMRGLVLADTRPQADTEQGREARRRMIELTVAAGPAAVADEMLPKLLCDETSRARPEVVEQVRRLILAAPRDAIVGALYRLMNRPDSSAQLSEVRCPTLVVVGERDGITPPDLSREMRIRIADAQLEVIPSAGHLSNLEQPESFNELLRRFLNRV